jgi:hypothetical protein
MARQYIGLLSASHLPSTAGPTTGLANTQNRTGTHSNTVESAFSLLKRGIYGTFHNVSRKHLHRYVAEFDFRWNARKIDDGARTVLAIRKADGKRLRYKEPIIMGG